MPKGQKSKRLYGFFEYQELPGGTIRTHPQPAVNRLVAGSNPARGATFLDAAALISRVWQQIWQLRAELDYSVDPESLYRQLGHLIASPPVFNTSTLVVADHLLWIGRARALVAELNDLRLNVDLESASRSLLGPQRAAGFQTMMLCLYKALASAELMAPPAIRGAFIPAGNHFDAYAALAKVLTAVQTDVLIIDPYLDEVVLTDFAASIPDGVQIRLMADLSFVKPTLAPASKKWAAQYSQKPLLVRLAPPKTLHDRAILVDGATAWALSQSIKDFAKRSPAEIIRADDTAALKISAYEVIWQNASPLI